MTETTMIREPVDVMTLIDKGVTNNLSPEAMGQLYQLHQRIQADNAKREFREAMTRFQADCPSVGKDRDGHGYRYATLEHIADTIRAPLAACGLSYTFNAIQTAEEVRVACTVHHISGHSETAEFASVACGTKMMNATQMRASALSYGRRYALTMALGLVIRAEDDDGHASAPPDAPLAADEPVTQPRGKRVTTEQCKALFFIWQKQMKSNDLDFSDAAWIAVVTKATKIAAERVFKPADWSTDDLAAVAKEIGVEYEQ